MRSEQAMYPDHERQQRPDRTQQDPEDHRTGIRWRSIPRTGSVRRERGISLKPYIRRAERPVTIEAVPW